MRDKEPENDNGNNKSGGAPKNIINMRLLGGGKLNLYLLRVCCCAQKEWECLWPIQKAAGLERTKRPRVKKDASGYYFCSRATRSRLLALAHKNTAHTIND
jgi:hypothetical protein